MNLLRKANHCVEFVIAAVLWPFRYIGHFFALPRKEELTRVEWNDNCVRCIRPDGRVDELAWEDLNLVAVETNDCGPFIEDVYFFLGRPENGFYIPQSAKGAQELVVKLMELPSFNDQNLTSAMSCADNAWFPCWKKDAVNV